ncbi:MAG: hypothetical protein ABW048_11585 [Sphingobium sp.]
MLPASCRAVPALLAVVALGACATPQAQLRTGLADAGLPASVADCMAKNMTPRLSVTQLLRLRSLSRVSGRNPQKTGIDAYLHQVRALGDGEIWSITARAATRCALGL